MEIIEVNSAAGGCTCGGHDAEVPELDVRAIPHAIRHASVFGAWDSIAAGASLILVAPHNPLPLLNQLAERSELEVEYLSEEPQQWRPKLTKGGARS